MNKAYQKSLAKSMKMLEQTCKTACHVPFLVSHAGGGSFSAGSVARGKVAAVTAKLGIKAGANSSMGSNDF